MVIHFHFRDAGPRERRWWLVVETTVRALTEIWTGDSNPKSELTAGRLRVTGAERDARDLWRWLGRSMFAPSHAAR